MKPPFQPRRFRFLFLLIVAGAFVLASCSTSTAPPVTTTTSPGSSSTTSTTAPTAASSSTTTTTSPNQCSTGVLSASATPGGSAAGTAYETVTVTNGGPTTCTVDGFVDIAFYGPSAAGGAGSGPRLDISVVDSSTQPSPVTLASKADAEFLVVYSDVPAGGVGCSTVASAEFSLPGNAEELTLPVSMTLCGGSVRVDPFGAPGSENP